MRASRGQRQGWEWELRSREEGGGPGRRPGGGQSLCSCGRKPVIHLVGALAEAGPGLADDGVCPSLLRVPGWPMRCSQAQSRAGLVRGGGAGGGPGEGPGARGGAAEARERARRPPPGPAAAWAALLAVLLRPRPRRADGQRQGFRLTSLCLEFSAASPDARSQFHGLWAPRGARDRKPAGAGRGWRRVPGGPRGEGRRGEGLLSCWQGCVCARGVRTRWGRHQELLWEGVSPQVGSGAPLVGTWSGHTCSGM